MLNGLDLFSGIGGLSLALAPWVKPIAYCENDRFAQSVLLSRMRDGTLPIAGIWDDVKTLRPGHICTPEVGIDIIYGGFPCQDISVAGHGVGLEGKRSGLFYEILRLTGEISPSFLFLENVPAIRTRGAERVCKELAFLGYDCRWLVISAAEVGARHVRNRWFLLAHSNRRHKWNLQQWPAGRRDDLQTEGKAQPIDNGASAQLAHADCVRGREGRPWKEIWGRLPDFKQCSHLNWPEEIPEPSICGVAHGIPGRVDRLRALGNAVVPAQAREAFMRLMGIHEPKATP